MNNSTKKFIPDGWKIKKLGDVGRVSMCKRIMKSQTSELGDIPFFKIGTFGRKPDAYIPKEVYEDYIKKYSFPKKGDILISASGTIGRTIVYDGKPAYYQDSNIIWIANEENLVLNSYLRYLYDKVRWQTASGTIARLYNDNVRAIEIFIPEISEQKRIVSILQNWDGTIEKLEKKIEIKKKIKKGLMQNLLNGNIRLAGFIENWKKLSLKDCMEIKHGKSQKDIETIDGKYPILATGGVIGKTNIPLYTKPSVLIGRKGTIDKPQYMDTPFWTIDTLFYSKIKSNSLAKFLYYKFLTINWKQYSEASGLPSLSASTISSIQILLPPLDEQHVITDILTSADKELDTLTVKLFFLKEQRKYLLNNLVTGTIRTPENLKIN